MIGFESTSSATITMDTESSSMSRSSLSLSLPSSPSSSPRTTGYGGEIVRGEEEEEEDDDDDEGERGMIWSRRQSSTYSFNSMYSVSSSSKISVDSLMSDFFFSFSE